MVKMDTLAELDVGAIRLTTSSLQIGHVVPGGVEQWRFCFKPKNDKK